MRMLFRFKCFKASSSTWAFFSVDIFIEKISLLWLAGPLINSKRLILLIGLLNSWWQPRSEPNKTFPTSQRKRFRKMRYFLVFVFRRFLSEKERKGQGEIFSSLNSCQNRWQWTYWALSDFRSLDRIKHKNRILGLSFLRDFHLARSWRFSFHFLVSVWGFSSLRI